MALRIQIQSNDQYEPLLVSHELTLGEILWLIGRYNGRVSHGYRIDPRVPNVPEYLIDREILKVESWLAEQKKRNDEPQIQRRLYRARYCLDKVLRMENAKQPDFDWKSVVKELKGLHAAAEDWEKDMDKIKNANTAVSEKQKRLKFATYQQGAVTPKPGEPAAAKDQQRQRNQPPNPAEEKRK